MVEVANLLPPLSLEKDPARVHRFVSLLNLAEQSCDVGDPDGSHALKVCAKNVFYGKRVLQLLGFGSLFDTPAEPNPVADAAFEPETLPGNPLAIQDQVQQLQGEPDIGRLDYALLAQMEAEQIIEEMHAYLDNVDGLHWEIARAKLHPWMPLFVHQTLLDDPSLSDLGWEFGACDSDGDPHAELVDWACFVAQKAKTVALPAESIPAPPVKVKEELQEIEASFGRMM